MRALFVALALVACSGPEFQAFEELQAAGSGGTSGGAGGRQAPAGGASGASSTAGSTSSGGSVGGAGEGDGEGGGGGAGAAGAEPCELPPREIWTASASHSDPKWPPALAVDGDGATRFSTGRPQAGDEWLAVDFGGRVTLSGVVLDCCEVVNGYPESLEDWGRAFEVRLSDAPGDVGAPVLAASSGTLGPIELDFAAPATGRYLLVTQTGVSDASWWSVHELAPVCEHETSDES